MPLSHLLLALLVVAVWGTNFVVIKWGLSDLPPFLFASLRFGLSTFPLVLVLRRPRVPWRTLAAFGVLLGVGQFGLMFYAMQRDITPGLASLVIQMQVFFTIGLAMFFAREWPRPVTGIALVIALVGMSIIVAHLDTRSVTVKGLVLVLLAAVGWAGANLVVKSVGRIDTLAFIVWSGLFSVPPLFAMSLFFEGPTRIVASLAHAGPGAYASVVWQALGNTLFGYGAWNFLLARHPAATVAPAALLVPVFGMTASSLLLGEPMPPWKLGATSLVLIGLGLNTLGTRPPATPPTVRATPTP